MCRFCYYYPNFKCCLIKRKEKKILIKDCKQKRCISFEDCKNALAGNLPIENIPDIEDFFKIKYKIRNPLSNFTETFYPKVEIGNEIKRTHQMEIIRKLKFGGIAVSLEKMISTREKGIIKKPMLQDLHKTLEFDGEILLATNINDYKCQALLQNIEKVPKILKVLNPDVMTTFDANFYINQPLFITAIQLIKILRANKLISGLDIKKVGLVPPASIPFLDIALLAQLNTGYTMLGIPMMEINKERDLKVRRQVIRHILNIRFKIAFEFMLLSTSPIPRSGASSFSSLSWTIVPESKKLSPKEKNREAERRLLRDKLKARRIISQEKFQKKLINRR